jgi:hypothetical protein
MHFIVNTDLKREGGYAALIEQLEHQNISYTLVRKPPTADFLVSMHDEYDADGHNIPIMLEHIDEPVFVTGTTSMQAVSIAHGWVPGYITAPSQAECIEHWGEHMLNHNARWGRIDEIVPPDGPFFTRPDLDLKAFSGIVFDPSNPHEETFEEFRARIVNIKGWTNCPPDTIIMIAPVIDIWAEYRCIMIDGHYVTGSRYKTGRTVAYSSDVGNRIIEYANARISEWNPRVAVTLDIADTPDGLKIIETNSISSSGFYAIDMNRFVGEINALTDRYE